MEMALNDKMQPGHVVYVRDDGTVLDANNVYAPEITCDYYGPFSEGQILDEHEREMIEYAARQGWTLQTGWSGQDSGRYNGPIMHASEYIGGSLEAHIKATPGLWVADSVELHPGEEDPEYKNGSGESEAAGWVLAFRMAVHYGESRIACGAYLASEGYRVTDIKKITCPECLEVVNRPMDISGTTLHPNGMREWPGNSIITNF